MAEKEYVSEKKVHSKFSFLMFWWLFVFLGLNLDKDEMKDLFERFDADGSGSINVTEFLQGIRVGILMY